MTLDRVFTRFDERFVAASLDGIVVTDRVLADIKSKKREARFALFGVKRVDNAGFRRAQFQAHTR